MSEKQKGSRPVRICIAMEEKNPIRRSLEMVFGAIGDPMTHQFVQTIGEADLVIFHKVREIEKNYSNSKTYAFVGFSEESKSLPKEVVNLSAGGSEVMCLANLIQRVWLTLIPLEAPKVEVKKEVVPLRPDALRILVIDDTALHIASAKEGLTGHLLTTVDGYEEAMNILSNEKFDVVLTDLHLPMSSKTMGGAFKLGELVPYGILLMIEAARQGAKYVAVVTDLNHHVDPFSAAFDHYSRFPVKIQDAKVVMMHAPMKGEAKDWAVALDRLMKE